MVFTAYSSLGTVWEGQESCMQDPLVIKMAEKYGKSTALILLKWGLERGYVILPKSVSSSRVVVNSQLFDYEISNEELRTWKL